MAKNKKQDTKPQEKGPPEKGMIEETFKGYNLKALEKIKKEFPRFGVLLAELLNLEEEL